MRSIKDFLPIHTLGVATVRRRIALTVTAVAALALWAGCKDDDDSLGNSEARTAGYVAFAIRIGDSATRAIAGDDDDTDYEFSKGELYEYDLSPNPESHQAFFFDNLGNYYGSAMITSESLKPGQGGHGGSDNSHNADKDYPKEEVFYTLLTSYPSSRALAPNRALVVINGNPKILTELDRQLKAEKKYAAMSRALQWLGTDYPGLEPENANLGVSTYKNTIYFTMTNSTFMPRESETGTLQTAVEVSDKFFDYPEEAMEHPVQVYVERVVAKYSVEYKGKDIAHQERIDPEVWDKTKYVPAAQLPVTTFNPDKYFEISPEYSDWWIEVSDWGTNALEETSFLFKNVMPANDSWRYDTPWQITQSFYRGWNDPGYHRSYWAVDRHYLADDENYRFADDEDYMYPTQYRAAGGLKTGVKYFDEGGNEESNNLALKYIPYNGIGQHRLKAYSLENTYADTEGLRDHRPLHYGTHILLAAKLHITALNESENLYYAYSTFWQSKEDYMKYAFAKLRGSFYALFAFPDEVPQLKHWKSGDSKSLEHFKTRYGKMADQEFYKKVGDKYESITFDDVTESFFELATAYTEHGDGRQILEHREGDDNKIYILCPASKPEDGDNAEGEENNAEGEGNDEGSVEVLEYTEILEDDIKTLIYSFVDPVDHFTGGAMYYAIPIKHNDVTVELATYDKDNPQTDALGRTLGLYSVGNFGVVRNHWYKINVKAIGSVGTPVDNPDQPIVPNDPDPVKNVAVEIKILPWRVVDSGGLWL